MNEHEQPINMDDYAVIDGKVIIHKTTRGPVVVGVIAETDLIKSPYVFTVLVHTIKTVLGCRGFPRIPTPEDVIKWRVQYENEKQNEVCEE